MRRTSRDGSGTVHCYISQADLLKMKKNGQFPDESVRVKGTGTPKDKDEVNKRDVSECDG